VVIDGVARENTDQRIALTVSVDVGVPDLYQVVVDDPVAVVVEAIADLFSPHESCRVGIITVLVVGDVACGISTQFLVRPEALTVPIEVTVVELRQLVVDYLIAVVVHPITGLFLGGIHIGPTVVTVEGIGCIVTRPRTDLDRVPRFTEAIKIHVDEPQTIVQLAIAVVVCSVTELFGTGVDIPPKIIAVLGSSEAVAVEIVG
jgi:hypothetical protein